MAKRVKNERTAAFSHYGISPWEIEVIYDTLKRSFEVEEKQLEVEDTQYASMIEIEFPIPYNESFFQSFTIESWFKIKGVLKDIKRRRGRKLFKAFLRFAGIGEDTTSVVVFPLLSKGDRQFEMSLEKIEYIVDIVPIQLKSLPQKIEVWYMYDEITSKWNPSIARSNSDNNYILKNNEWKMEQ